jgi:HlyD family secretion protein
MSKVLSWSFVLWLLPASAAPGDEVRAEVVKRGSITATVKAVGVLQPEELVDVGAQVAGQVQRLGVDPGDAKKAIDFNSRVEAGTVLAQIDPTLYQAGVDRARAQLHKAQAALKLAEAKSVQTDREAQRARELSKRQAITREDSDHARGRQEIARAEAELARADVELAQAGLKEAEANLAYTAIRAPIKGVIIDRRVNVGQNVVTGLNAPSLFIIARDVKRLQVWAMVKEADVGRIKSGQTVHFTVDAFPNEHFNGAVAAEPRLNATMTQNAVTYTVVINVEATNIKLLPYMTAHIEIVTAEPGNTSRPPRKTGAGQPGATKVPPKVMTYVARAAAGYNVLNPALQELKTPRASSGGSSKRTIFTFVR